MRKRIAVLLVVIAIMLTLPSWGATFKNRRISDQEFCDICSKGSVQEVLNAINKGANVNARNQVGTTALMYASLYGKVDVVNVLIEAGADDEIDNEGQTALIHATTPNDFGHYCSNVETVHALIDAGSYIKQKDKWGKMAVDYARQNEKLKGTDALKRLEELSR